MSIVFVPKKIYLVAILTALFIVAMIAAATAQAEPEVVQKDLADTASLGDKIPNITPDMQNEQFWLRKLANANQLIMNEIAAFNKEILAQSPAVVYDLTVYPQMLDKKMLTAMLLDSKFPSAQMYSGEIPLASSFYKKLLEQMNLSGLREKNAVRYAFTVTRANIRTFPTSQGVFDSPGDSEFDNFQETIVDPAEPLLILHQSFDQQWYYVQTSNYRGWMAVGDIAAVPSRESWISYMTRPDFLIVTGSNLSVELNAVAKPVYFEMGAKLPLVASEDPDQYRIELPVRDGNGMAVFTQAVLPVNRDVSVGYLPYTRENILHQAFKMKNIRYGWGGLFHGVDCSAFVMDVYRTFGIMLPRNADQQQATAGKSQNLNKLSTETKRKIIHSLKPGAALFIDGHVVLYLGEDEGHQYIIHALTSYGDAGSHHGDGLIRKVAVMRVVLSDVDLLRTNGKTLLDSFIGSKQYEIN